MLGGDGNFSVRLRKSRPRLSTSRFQFHIRGHSGKDAASRIIDANLYAKHLVHTFLAGLHIARQEFSLLIDLF